MFAEPAADNCRQPQQEAQTGGNGFHRIYDALQPRKYGFLINIYSI